MKRFGVSLPTELAEAVDKLSQELGVTRSDVVANAVQEYLEARKSHADHECIGVVLALADDMSDLGDVIEGNRDYLLAYTHMHVEGKCLAIAVVKGNGGQLQRIAMELSKKAQVVRYTPLL